MSAAGIDSLIKEVASKVITQPLEQVADCAYFALQNLYVRCGLEPPTIQRMKDVVISPDPFIGIGPVQIMTMLTEMAFPGIVALAIVPHGSTARDVFPALMASGWRLLISYTFTAQITREGALSVVGDADFAGMTMFAGHALVPFESDDEGLFVIVGWPSTPVEKVSWKTMPSMAWNLDGQPCGIAREFVMVKAYGN
jgi:hypothetical protein